MKSSFRDNSLFSPNWWLMLLLTALVAGLTFRLGFWQLGRAELRESIAAELSQRAALPALDAEALGRLGPADQLLYRRLAIEGRWLDQWTVALNRPQNGRPGFWVMTPMMLDNGRVLLIQRGWTPRDPVQPEKLPALKAHTETESIQGQWIEPPSHLMELEADQKQAVDFARVRQNLALDAYERQTGLHIMAVMRQTSPSPDGLLREWPDIASKAPMNRGYAVQWFALGCAAVAYFVWFQIYRKLRDARHHPRTTD